MVGTRIGGVRSVCFEKAVITICGNDGIYIKNDTKIPGFWSCLAIYHGRAETDDMMCRKIIKTGLARFLTDFISLSGKRGKTTHEDYKVT